MTTVREFKDLGVEFVIGDECQGDTCIYDGSWYIYGNDDSAAFIRYDVILFAWRPLNMLPYNPKFKVEIDANLHQWRPLLDQSSVKPSDDKPVFTQAMADAGELPPVGSYFTVSGLVGECLLIHCGDIIAKFNTGVMPVNKHECKPIDTRTPKQKAVEHMLDIWARSDISGSEALFETIYDELIDKC